MVMIVKSFYLDCLLWESCVELRRILERELGRPSDVRTREEGDQ